LPPRSTVWPLEPHTAAKHAILREYLKAWLPIMSYRNERIVYLDGFAGPGEYVGGEPGSPVVALDTAIQHTADLDSELVFVFMEADEKRCLHLGEKLKAYAELPDNYVIRGPLQGTFDEQMSDLLGYLESQGVALAPTFALVDPFGVSDTPISVIKRIMRSPKCEVLITFMYQWVNRFVEGTGDTFPEHVDELFGTDEWRQVAGKSTPDERRRFLRDLYKRQLRREAGIEYVHTFEMRDKNNQTEYFLFFGTNHIRGLEKMKEAMWKVDPGQGNRFSDFTYSEEPVLLDATPQFDKLRRMILEWGAGSEWTVEDVERFVLLETPFAKSHYNRRVLQPLERESVIRVVSSPRRGSRGFPPGTVIRFPPPGS